MNWDRVSRPKRFGGLGFKKLHEFNLAVVGKQAWKLINDPQSMATRLLKAKYFSKTRFFNAHIGNNSSYLWRSIWKSWTLIAKGCCRPVGRGSSILLGKMFGFL